MFKKKEDMFDINTNENEKAGYNQAARITETLAMLRNTYVSSMIDDDFSAALKVARRVLDIISAKLNPTELSDTDAIILKVKKQLPSANETFVSGGYSYYKNQKARNEIEILIENLWRKIEKLQDTHGYGMLAEEEYGL